MRSSLPPVKPREPCPQRLTQSQHPLLTSVPFSLFSKHHASLSPSSSSSSSSTHSPAQQRPLVGAYCLPTPCSIPCEQVVDVCVCVCPHVFRVTGSTVNLSGEWCRATKQGLLVATPLHLRDTQFGHAAEAIESIR